ncbi:MAG: hypothetical protein KA116_10350 [Proteobacteria bacterium]|nr:hypothetical protein [Pseudomonadota bacterium]
MKHEILNSSLDFENTNSDSKIILQYTFLLSITEVGLGALIHGLHIPLGGHFLSLNEGYLLCKALRERAQIKMLSRKEAFKQSCSISIVGALLKSFSPAGKKLTPMLAISVQGLLFSIGVYFFGVSLLGLILGMLLLSLWAFIQPLLFAWLIFGKTFFEGLLSIWTHFSESVGINSMSGFYLLGIFVALKLISAILVAILVWRGQLTKLDGMSERISRLGELVLLKKEASVKKEQSPFYGALKDILSPLFIMGLLFSVFLAIYSQSTLVPMIWMALRPVAFGFLMFYFLRAFNTEKLRNSVLMKFPKFGFILNGVLSKISLIQKIDRGPEATER